MKKGINPSFLNNLWIEKFESQANWSWLEPDQKKPSYSELLKSEWGYENESFFYNFDDTFRSRCKDRMIMGSMRYDMLASKGYKFRDGQFYLSRMSLASEVLETNLEGYYDYANMLFLYHKSGKARKAVVDNLKLALLQCYNENSSKTGYFPVDRG